MIAQRHPRDTVEEYMDGILSGDIVSGRLQKLAVQRHIDDLKHADERGYYHDGSIASRAVMFPECLSHSIGAYSGRPFILEPWQSFVTWCVHGWRRKVNGFRRFKNAYVCVAAKNGKSTFAASQIHYHLHADEPFEPGAHVFVTAPKLDQAKLSYDEARRMIDGNRHLAKRCDVYKANPPRIFVPRWESYATPIALDGNLDGINAHAIVEDELHAMREKHREGREKLAARGAARRQCLRWMFTTAGSDSSEIWIREDEYAVKVLESVVSGNIIDDEYFSFITRPDDGDDLFSVEAWKKANPCLGVTVPLDFMIGEANRAKNQPSETNKFLRYHCNMRVAAAAREISAEMWKKGANALTVQDGAECHGGVDLARSNDWAAISLCFPIRDEEGRVIRHEIKSIAWTCKHGQFRIEREPFRTWISQGILRMCDGDQIDFAEIEREILKLNQQYSVHTWAFDPAWSRELMQRLNVQEGVNIFPMFQSHAKYNEACVRLVKDMDAGTIWHGNDPCLEWQAGNLIYNRNHEGLSKPDKSNRESKIDGMVATLMALSECLFAEKESLNYYDNNEVEMG